MKRTFFQFLANSSIHKMYDAGEKEFGPQIAAPHVSGDRAKPKLQKKGVSDMPARCS
jgi:hypothetical protein